MPRRIDRATIDRAATGMAGPTRTMLPRHLNRPARLAALVSLLALSVVLAGCGGVSSPAPAASPAPPPPPRATRQPSASPAPDQPRLPCLDGRLRIGDLDEIDVAWVAGVRQAAEHAVDWQPDARLVRLRVGCQPLEPAFRWQGTFYSQTAQSFYQSDTELTEPAEVDPTTVPTLPTDQLSFLQLQRSLARAGYADADQLGAASGVSVRLNAARDRFGPPDLPLDVVVYHVAVDDQGEVRDLFVSAADWTIRQY